MNQDESPQAITWTITSTDEELLMQTDSQCDVRCLEKACQQRKSLSIGQYQPITLR